MPAVRGVFRSGCIGVSVTPEIAKTLDGIAAQRGMSRTATIRTLMRESIERGVKEGRRGGVSEAI